jgi:hypothetical protein
MININVFITMSKNIDDDYEPEEVLEDIKEPEDEVDYDKINDKIIEIIEEFEHVEPKLKAISPSDILYPCLINYGNGHRIDDSEDIYEMIDIIFNMIESNIKDKIDVDDVFYDLSRELMYKRIINRITSIYT